MSQASLSSKSRGTIGYWAPLERAWERMKELLFRPFHLGFWCVLGFSAWLAGLGSGPGGSGANFGDHSHDFGRSLRHGISSLMHNTLLISIFLFVGLAVLVFVAILLWISSRGKFIYLDNVLRQRAEIVEPWGRLRKLGDSLFLWRLGFVLSVFLLAILLVGIPMVAAAVAGGGDIDSLSVFSLSAMGVVIVLSVIFLALGATLIGLFLESFIVPIMYRFELKTTEAWRYFIPWLKARPASFVGYAAFVLLLAIGFGILSVLACFMTCCLAALPYVGTVLFLPLLVTYRYFSLEWLSQFDEGFDFFSPLPGHEEAEMESVSEG